MGIKYNFALFTSYRQENQDIAGFLVQLQKHRSLRQEYLQQEVDSWVLQC